MFKRSGVTKSKAECDAHDMPVNGPCQFPKSRVIVGTAGVPPANAPQARRLSEVAPNSFALRAHLRAGTPAVPDNHLTDSRMQIADESSVKAISIHHQSSNYLHVMSLREHIKSGDRFKNIAIGGKLFEIASQGCRIT